MVYGKFVQIGGIAYIAEGRYQGKIAAIVNVVDQNRLLVDGPCTDVPRHVMNIKHVHLTKFRLFFPYTARTKTVRKAWEKSNVTESWKNTAWAKKIALKAKRASLSDFDRHTAMMLKKKRRKIINYELFKLRRERRKKLGRKEPVKKEPKESKPKNAAKAPKPSAKTPKEKKAPKPKSAKLVKQAKPRPKKSDKKST